MQIGHKLFGMLGHALRTRAKWVTLKTGTSRFKIQAMLLNDLSGILLVENLTLAWDCAGT